MGLFFDPKPERVQVWMNGGGGQSAGLAALICTGDLPKPDWAVLVNTGRERSATFDYYESYVRPALERCGVRCIVVEKEHYATVDLTSTNGKHILIPAFTNQSGEVGKLTNYCSKEWKLRVKRRWLREIQSPWCLRRRNLTNGVDGACDKIARPTFDVGPRRW